MTRTELVRAQSRLDPRASAVINAILRVMVKPLTAAVTSGSTTAVHDVVREALVVLAEELEHHAHSIPPNPPSNLPPTQRRV